MKVKVPSSLKDIKLKDFQKYQDRFKFLTENKATETEFIISKIATICGLEIIDVVNIEANYIFNINLIIDNIFLEEPKLVQKFELNGLQFGFVPSLDEISYGELMDLNTSISDWATMHQAMAVLYRPIIKNDKIGRYLIEKYNGKYHAELQEMDMEAVMSSMVFFWNLGLDLLKSTSKYLTQEANPPNFQLIGDGLPQ